MMLSTADRRALDQTAARLGVGSNKLKALIQFESRFNPTIKNPYSSARGLIQFVDSTARRLGYNSSADLVSKHPTVRSQLEGPVYAYLKQFKPFPTDQSLFMSVFYPKARLWPAGKQFSKAIQKVNPGIRTPGDYTKKVYMRAGLTYVPPVLILLGVSGILYITLFKKKGGIYGTTKASQGSGKK